MKERIMTYTLTAMSHSAVTIGGKEALLRLALASVYSDYDPQGLVKINIKPTLGVVATKAFAVGELTLVPLGTQISYTSAKVPSTAVALGTCTNEFTGRLVDFFVANSFEPGTCNQNDSKKKEPFTAPFWAVRKTADSALAQLEQASVTATVNISAKASRAEQVVIPVLRNTQPIPVGSELRVHEEVRANFGLSQPVSPAESKVDGTTVSKRPRELASGQEDIPAAKAQRVAANKKPGPVAPARAAKAREKR